MASDDAGVGWFSQLGRARNQRQRRDDHDHYDAKNHIAPGRVRPERPSFFFNQFLVFLAVGFGINRFAGFGRLGNAVAQDEPKVQPDKSKNEAGHDENVNRKKPGKGCATDGVAAQNKMREPLADERRAPGLFRRDDHGPNGVLIPAQELAGKTHDQSESQKQHAGRPVQFAGKFVGAGQKNLRHVQADHQDHGRRAVVMEAAQKMSERRLIADEVKRRIGFAGRGDVSKGQRNAGDHLNHEGAQRGAAEDIPPFGVRRHEMPRRLADHFGKAGAVVHPIPDAMENLFQHHYLVMGMGDV